MDDFAALKNLKGLSLRNPSKAADAKNASSLSTSSYVSSSTTQAVAANKRDSNLDRDAKRSSEEPEELFDYYNNTYQKYMAKHGGGGAQQEHEGCGRDGDGDGDGDGSSGDDGDETPRDAFGEGKHVGSLSPVTSYKGCVRVFHFPLCGCGPSNPDPLCHVLLIYS